MKTKKLKVLVITAMISIISISNCFATDSNFSGITTSITTAGSDMISASAPIIGAAVSLGVVFWGSKLLWSKFKSMAK